MSGGWRKAAKIAGVVGGLSVAGGAIALTQKMFVDRHAIVSVNRLPFYGSKLIDKIIACREPMLTWFDSRSTLINAICCFP